MEDSKINYNIHNHYPQTSEGVYRKACDSLHERNTLKLTSENDLTNVFIFPLYMV